MINENSIVIFDFDGVIADSFETLFKVCQLESPEITRQQCAARFIGNINQTHPSNKKFDFLSHWEPLVQQQKIFAGITEVISQLVIDVPLAIVSSTNTEPIKEFLHTNQLHNYFSHVLGNDVDPNKVVKINMLLKKTLTKPSQAIMITDTLGDLNEAHQAGIHTIAVTWGFHDRDTLLQGNPSSIINHPHQIPAQVNELLQLNR